MSGRSIFAFLFAALLLFPPVRTFAAEEGEKAAAGTVESETAGGGTDTTPRDSTVGEPLSVAQGYRAVVPEGVRLSVRNFFANIGMPIRFVNNLLQGKIRNSGVELLRFAINTTAGSGGLFAPAKNDFHLAPRDEDLGQTFGNFGLRHGLYIVFPLLGPSSLRDAIG